MAVGNGLTFVGFPDISATSVTAIQGVITGITAEKSGSSNAWLRTDSTLGGGMSGGGAYDATGKLVGIPTSAPATTGTLPDSLCLSIQDNTGDGLINDRDACVPIGGTVTAIRPILFAQPLIEAAKSGYRLDHHAGQPALTTLGDPAISRIFFSQGVDDQGVPTRILSGMPGGVNSVYLFFDYANMRPGTPYEIRVTHDGLDMPQFSLGPVAWGGGLSGSWYMGTENKTWPDGTYEFTILISGKPVAAASLTVGGDIDQQVFSDLKFGVPNDTGDFIMTGTMFPQGIQRFNGQFSFEGMEDGQDWTEVWSLDGSEVFRATYLWDKGPSGETSVLAENSQGLPMGTYRLELFIGQRLAATGDVVLAGNPGGQFPIVFSNASLANDITRDGLPSGQTGASGLVLPTGTTALYAFVDWDFMPNGLLWTFRWFEDGRLIASSTQLWDAGGVGTGYWVALESNLPLPDGAYAVEVLVDNRPMFSANVSVGSGAQPLSGEAAASSDVQISGRVIDALTGEGISGAMVAVLDVALELPAFTWNEKDIFTQAITDREGRFELPRGLTRGRFYTTFVFADGYITIVEDNFTIPREQPSPTDITIEMSKP